MIEVDGSQKSGSGTILRLSVALSAITGEPLHIVNIRQNRPQKGLKPQHLEAILTAAKLCNADLKGATLASRELWFTPKNIIGGNIKAEIGTAGSISMLLVTVLPICAFARTPVKLEISKGGTDVRNAPTINYMRFVFIPLLTQMGINASLDIRKYGYYPKGNGEVMLKVEPVNSLKSLELKTFGNLRIMHGISVCTFLEERKVAERQAKAAGDYFKDRGHAIDIRTINDKSNALQKGSSITLWAETDTNAILGSDAIGELKKPSEAVGIEAAEKLFQEVSAKPTVDVHLADLLIPYMALANGKSTYLTRAVSEHLETNIWLSEEILQVKFDITKEDERFRIEKVK